jgi:hypothetical protein
LPSTAAAAGGQAQLMDLAGDGRRYAVRLEGPAPGWQSRTPDGRWTDFRPFASRPMISMRDPNLRFIDLDGDGLAELLVSEHEVLRYYPSLGCNGFGPSQYTRKPHDEARGPAIVFADGTESIYLADMTGDGLTDIVRIRNGNVCYWPNLGYGRFGAQMILEGSPVFDHPDLFRQDHIRLADIDGSGTTDILYLGRDGVRYWINQAGNSLAPAQFVPAFPPVDSLSTVSVVDLLGTGTGCLVWSTSAPAEPQQKRRLRYMDLMGCGP